MKRYIIILTLIVSACTSNHPPISSSIETIPVDVHHITSDPSSFIEKIEIVPLETNDSALVNRYKKVVYDQKMNVFAIYGKDQIVHTFSGNGTYIANSKKVKGEGPKEYRMALDLKFNPYLEGIDLLSPYGQIFTYSPEFKFIAKREIKPEFVFDALMPLDRDNYIFTTPDFWTGQEVTFANLETKQQEVARYSGMISASNSVARECFYQVGNKFYFIPNGVHYYFYEIDEKK